MAGRYRGRASERARISPPRGRAVSPGRARRGAGHAAVSVRKKEGLSRPGRSHVSACGTRERPGGPPAPTLGAVTDVLTSDRQAKARRMEKAIRGYFDACNTGDGDAVAAYFAPGAGCFSPAPTWSKSPGSAVTPWSYAPGPCLSAGAQRTCGQTHRPGGLSRRADQSGAEEVSARRQRQAGGVHAAEVVPALVDLLAHPPPEGRTIGMRAAEPAGDPAAGRQRDLLGGQLRGPVIAILVPDQPHRGQAARPVEVQEPEVLLVFLAERLDRVDVPRRVGITGLEPRVPLVADELINGDDRGHSDS